MDSSKKVNLFASEKNSHFHSDFEENQRDNGFSFQIKIDIDEILL